MTYNILRSNLIKTPIYCMKLKIFSKTPTIYENLIYGFDREGGLYHLHPFLDTRQHIPANSSKNITDFAKESFYLLTVHGLL